MKRSKLYFITVILLIYVFIISACSSNKIMDGAKGTYNFVYEKGPLISSTEFDYQFILDGYGGGEYIHKGSTHKVKYKLEGTTINLTDTITGIKYTGTLQNGELHIYDGNPNGLNVTEFLYQKQ